MGPKDIIEGSSSHCKFKASIICSHITKGYQTCTKEDFDLQAGYTDVVHLKGGLSQWRYEGLPLENKQPSVEQMYTEYSTVYTMNHPSHSEFDVQDCQRGRCTSCTLECEFDSKIC